MRRYLLRAFYQRHPLANTPLDPFVGVSYAPRIIGKELAKEVPAFRRGGRVYFFTVLYSAKDGTAPEQVRRAISRLVWTK